MYIIFALQLLVMLFCFDSYLFAACDKKSNDLMEQMEKIIFGHHKFDLEEPEPLVTYEDIITKDLELKYKEIKFSGTLLDHYVHVIHSERYFKEKLNSKMGYILFKINTSEKQEDSYFLMVAEFRARGSHEYIYNTIKKLIELHSMIDFHEKYGLFSKGYIQPEGNNKYSIVDFAGSIYNSMNPINEKGEKVLSHSAQITKDFFESQFGISVSFDDHPPTKRDSMW